MSQVLSVVRIQLINWQYGFGLPLGILGLVLGLNLALFASLGDVAPPDGWTTGALMSIYITFGVGYLQTMTQTFPFALGLSVTRRAFYAGVTLLVLVESLLFGGLVTLLGAVERGTGGWGLQVAFFDLGFLRVDDPLLQWLVYTAPFTACALLGVVVGVVFKRWGQTGVYAVAIAATVLVGGAVVLITGQGWWPSVGSWLAGQPVAALAVGYPLALAVLLGGAGWLAMRRATP